MKGPLSKYFGPSTLVAAAFIGPGTVTTCTMAGVNSGYTLLWAMIFSIIATIVLQEMAARLGWITRQGLGEAIAKQFPSGVEKGLSIVLVLGAIVIGNAAYEAGNLSGGILGMELLIGEHQVWPIILGTIAFGLLFFGHYGLIEKILIWLVITMSISFLATVIIVKPDFGAIIKGMIPGFGEVDFLLVLGLIGTTVVPYNLFLHSSIISKKWNKDAQLSDIRTENTISIILGGLVSMMIIVTAAATRGELDTIETAKDLAVQLEPIFGSMAKYLMGIGLMAAGLSSALTAPLAAAYTARGLLGWTDNERSWKFRLIWIIILVIGVAVTMIGTKPILIIKFAQITNAILLPLIAAFLIYLCNIPEIVGSYRNKSIHNWLSISIVVITVCLSLRSLNKLFQIF